jgi:HEAT repeat protein
MPKVTVERGHGAVTDHTIGVPDPVGFEGVRTSRDACTGCHTGARGFPAGAPTLDAAGVTKAFAAWWPLATRRPAWSKAIALARTGDADALRRLELLARDTTAPRLARASAASLLGRVAGADPETLFDLARDADSLVRRAAVSGLAAVRSEEADAALLEALADPSMGVRVHAARAALEGWERVQKNAPLLAATLPVLARQAAVAPNEDRRWFRLAAARQIAGDLPGAIEAYERQCALDPFATPSRELIVRFKARLAKPK